MTTKQCRKCEEHKPLEAFHKQKTTRDGREGSCKACRHSASLERQKKRYSNDSSFRERRLDDSRRHYHETRKAQQFESGDRWVSNYTYRCKEVGVTPVIERFSPQDVIEKYHDRCYYCQHGEFEQLDHYVPISQGGPHTLDNVRPSCFACNRSKSDTDPLEFVASSVFN